MTRFNIGGQYLDLDEGLNIQFTKKNILFAFDSIECERSTSFDIPATPNNNAIFSLAKLVSCYGDKMRRRLDAQMQDGIVVKNGYIYVTEYDSVKRVYKAIFITGELLGLLQMRDLGTLAECEVLNTTISAASTSTPAEASSIYSSDQLFTNVKYRNNVGNTAVYPSVSVNLLLQDIVTRKSIKPITLPSILSGARIIPDKAHGVPDTKIKYTRTGIAAQKFGEPYDVVTNVSMLKDGLDILQPFIHYDTNGYLTYRRDYGTSPVQTITYGGYVKQTYFDEPVTLSFPQDFPTDCYLISVPATGPANLVFLGDYSFTNVYGTITRTGEPLSGRSVDIPAGTRFMVVYEDDYISINQGSFLGTTNGWKIPVMVGQVSTVEFSVKTTDEERTSGNVRLVDNLPDITIIDLLKYLSALSGLSLNYSESAGVTFDELNFSTWEVLNMDNKVISTKNVSRKFSDYAQDNSITFEYDAYVIDALRNERHYLVQNDNITAKKELLKIKVSNGGYAYGVLYINQQANTLYTFGNTKDAGDNMLRFGLIENTGITDLCTESTLLQIDCRMSLNEYENIDAKRIIYYAGANYVWTEAQWSKGVATLKLSKIM